MEQAKQAREVVLAFLDAYLGRRDYAAVLACLARRIQWVGTGGGELASGRAAVEQLLRDDLAASSAPFAYECRSCDELTLAQGDVLALLTLTVWQEGIALALRASFYCVHEDGQYRIAGLHASVANQAQEEGSFFPAHDPAADMRLFARQVGERTLDLLERSIPGGILGCYLEPDFPLYYVNRQTLSFLGYTREEFFGEGGGSYLPFLHPDDRERASAQVLDRTAADGEYELQYRVRRRDGSYAWVNDMGKHGVDADGREVCISVLRDITGEHERQQALEREAREKAEEAERYDRLYQSVLCGIVQYSVDGQGRVIFENANPEAIRIFGYEPEEFWARANWDLAELIDERDREAVFAQNARLQAVGDKGSYEYRLRQKDGRPCWIVGSAELIVDGAGNAVVQSVFLDVDQRKRAEHRSRQLAKQVEASNELLRLALEHTTSCECYYDLRTRRLMLPARAQSYYQTAAEYRDMPESFAFDRVEEGDRAVFCGIFARLDRGERTASAEFRVRGQGLYCRATFSALPPGEDSEHPLVIGVLEDITRQKEMEQALSDAHARDGLTGLYNREYGVRAVRQTLEQRQAGECCGLMLLDMDGFGRINEQEGTAFADALLQEVADVLRQETAEGDIAVRLGGDEFMLLLRNCSKARASVVGPRIAQAVRAIMGGDGREHSLSVSIGMCVTDVAPDYAALYRCAESTLSYVKTHARGTAACYLDTSQALGAQLTQLYTAGRPLNDVDRASLTHDEDLVSFALELLGKAKNLDDAVFLLFARVGKSLGLDSVSLLEVDRAYQCYRYTYQWTRARADLRSGREYDITPDEIEAIEALYGEDGLSEQVLREGFAAPSCLHAPVWNYGEYTGTMSFERNEPGHVWSERERKLLKELVKLVPSFLLKARADAVSRAKTDFLSRMSHEIRTPMNAISGMTTIAKSVLDDREKTLDCLEKIESANQYLLELINDILDMSRIESGHMSLVSEPLDLGGLLDRLEALLAPQAQAHGLELRFCNRARGRAAVLGDGLRLNQVLINLIGNAIKFTPAGGSVEVAVDPAGEDALRFTVCDTGVGIAPADLRRIFNAFEQADQASQSGGTGLGLAISSRLVQLMGGQLEVESVVGVGSNFFFTLPLARTAQPAAPQQPEPAPVQAGRTFAGLRLLVAEDNELNREIVRTILEMHGFETLCVCDGAEAVAAFTAHEPGHFDAVLMDIRMPVMDGLEATRRIRISGRPDARTVPILALTANAFDEDTRKSLASGMNGHLSKPLQIDRLLELLAQSLGR